MISSSEGFERQLVYALRGALGSGMSLREAEERTGVSFNTLHRWAREGVQSRTLIALTKLADWLGFEIKLVRKAGPACALPERMRPKPTSDQAPKGHRA